jgi:unsaturated chondroitin disaccharide hydrolase
MTRAGGDVVHPLVGVRRPRDSFLTEAATRTTRALTTPATATPHYAEHGRWVDVDIATFSEWRGDFYDHGNWTAGFWVGLLLEIEALGGRSERDLAARVARAVGRRATDGGTHDIGFLFAPSACALHDVTGDDEWRSDALAAAETLAARFRPAGGYLQAFGTLDDERSAGTSTVDTMMNLPLLFWASEVTGDARFRELATAHVDATARNILRPDGSTYHLIRYDADGDVVWQGTYQGLEAASCWTRGQAWAIHGFVTAARETGEARFVELAARTLDYYWRALPDAAVLPPYDLVAPTDLVDSSAAAIVASALAEAALDPVLSSALDARRRAVEVLEALDRHALFDDEVGILAHAVYSAPHGLGVDGPLPYGEYFYLRALRLLGEVSGG